MQFEKPAQFISLIFQPLIMITYSVLIMMCVNPFSFGVNNLKGQSPLFLMVFFLTFMFPVLVILLLRRLNLITSINLPTSKERIIPYIATGIFYLWAYVTTKSNPDLPFMFKSFMLGSVISIFIVFFINNFSKISAHMAGMGGFLVFSFCLAYGLNPYSDFTVLFGDFIGSNEMTLPAIAVFISGLTFLSRYILKAHTITELIGGLTAGILGQIIALRIWF